jgi:hypothetical protein
MLKEEVNTIIVGSGPSGLLNAIGLLQKNPQKKILILEKRAEYSRNHVVRFDDKKLAEYIKAIGGEPIPELTELHNRLKKSSAIRISELERELKKIALRMGAEIEHTDVNNVQTQIYDQYPNLELVIGCDGTHSTVSNQAFGPENQVKHSFDYVLQVRFEVLGSEIEKVDLPTWPAYLQAYGLAGEEILGKTANGKSPMTMQIMINKEDFDALTPYAQSKDPIKPFDDAETRLDHVPAGIMGKVKGYLGLRLAHYTKHNSGQQINLSDVRISVNEAPATRAKSVLKYQEVNGRKVCVMLAGDAALGLSYFKGVDAALENMSKALVALNTDNEEVRKEKLDKYATWFDQDLAPRKVKEVENYSKYIARLTENLFSFLNWVLGRDFLLNTTQAERFADLYHVSQREAQINNTNPQVLQSPYLHRRNYFYAVLSNTPVPLSEYGNDISDHFKKFFTVYKSNQYLYRDLLQPFTALKHILVGAAKLILSPIVTIIYTPLNLAAFFLIVQLNLAKMSEFKMRWQQTKDSFTTSLARMVDGIGEIGLGLTLAVTSILLPIKVITNIVLTKTSEPRKIETNPGMLRLLKEAEKMETNELSINQMHALLIDVHRKFLKSVKKSQKTEVSLEEENLAYKACKLNAPESYRNYFRLFKPILPADPASNNVTSPTDLNSNQL